MPDKAQNFILEVAPGTAKGAPIPADAEFVKVGFTRTKGVTQSTETIDDSSDEDPNNASAVPGMDSFNFNADGLYVYDDAGQEAIQAAKDNQGANSFPWFRLTPNKEGEKEYIGQAIITEIGGPEGSTNEMLAYSLSTQGVGALTIQSVPAAV